MKLFISTFFKTPPLSCVTEVIITTIDWPPTIVLFSHLTQSVVSVTLRQLLCLLHWHSTEQLSPTQPKWHWHTSGWTQEPCTQPWWHTGSHLPLKWIAITWNHIICVKLVGKKVSSKFLFNPSHITLKFCGMKSAWVISSLSYVVNYLYLWLNKECMLIWGLTKADICHFFKIFILWQQQIIIACKIFFVEVHCFIRC